MRTARARLSIAVVATFWLIPSVGQAGPGEISTFAGGGIDEGKPGPEASLHFPTDVAAGPNGEIYIADSRHHRIRKVDTGGLIRTVAGDGVAGFGGDGGSALSARLSTPSGLTFDAEGNLLIADTGNNRIRKVDPSGGISTLAGDGAFEFDGDGGPAVAASTRGPVDVAVGPDGAVFVAEVPSRRIRRIGPDGIITTVAGNGGSGFSGDGGLAIDARMSRPGSIVVDEQGTLFIADQYEYRVRAVTDGIIQTVVGTGSTGCITFVRCDGGTPETTQVQPVGLAQGPEGGILIADAHQGRVLVLADGRISIRAGGGLLADDRLPANRTWFPYLTGVAGGPDETVFVSQGGYDLTDEGEHRVRKIEGGHVEVIAGNGMPGYTGDGGPAAAARFGAVSDLAADGLGNVYVLDPDREELRWIDANGSTSTVHDWRYDYNNEPGAVAADPRGNVYVTQGWGYREVLRFKQDGTYRIVANEADGIYDPSAMAADSHGDVFVGQWGAILKLDFTETLIDSAPTGYLGSDPVVTRVAGGSIDCEAEGDTVDEMAILYPGGIALDADDNLYLTDGCNRVRRIAPNGAVTTVAGTGQAGYSGDGGPAVAARLNRPGALAVDPDGNLYIADTWNHLVRRVDPSGTISTVAGTGVAGFSGDGSTATSAALSYPVGVAITAGSRLLIADRGNARIRVLQL